MNAALMEVSCSDSSRWAQQSREDSDGGSEQSRLQARKAMVAAGAREGASSSGGRSSGGREDCDGGPVERRASAIERRTSREGSSRKAGRRERRWSEQQARRASAAAAIGEGQASQSRGRRAGRGAIEQQSQGQAGEREVMERLQETREVSGKGAGTVGWAFQLARSLLAHAKFRLAHATLTERG